MSFAFSIPILGSGSGKITQGQYLVTWKNDNTLNELLSTVKVGDSMKAAGWVFNVEKSYLESGQRKMQVAVSPDASYSGIKASTFAEFLNSALGIVSLLAGTTLIETVSKIYEPEWTFIAIGSIALVIFGGIFLAFRKTKKR